MTAQQMQEALRQLDDRVQVAFLTVCVEHVYSACESNEIVERALEFAWEFALNSHVDNRAASDISSAIDDFLSEDTNTEMMHIIAAAELIVKSVSSVNDAVVQVLNNVEAVVHVIDPRPELGMVEERQWQARALEFVSSVDQASIRDIVKAIDQKTEWLERFRSDSLR